MYKKYFIFFVFSSLFCLCENHILAQTQLSPNVVSSGGGFGTDGNGNSYSFTIGECVTVTRSNTNNILTQGFQQPVNDSTIIVIDSLPITFYNGITPNGDGKNDSWILDGIDSLTNSVSIFNRWGDLVWKEDNYDNVNVVWVGKNNKGVELPPATYFYIIHAKGGPYSGWVELTR